MKIAMRTGKSARQHTRTRKALIGSILTTSDFSPESLKGVRYAVSLARYFNADITVLHVVEPPPPFTGYEKVVLARNDAALAVIARAKLAKLVQSEMKTNGAVSYDVVAGKPFDKIVKFAQKSKVDLIVLSTHGFSGIKRVMMGSTTEHVVRHATCPVLTVPAKYEGEPVKPKRIFVPIDFSNLSKDALPYARLLAEAFGAEIVLGSVIEQYPEAPLIAPELTTQVIMPMMRGAESELERVADELRALTAVKVNAAVSAGRPWQQICRMAYDADADLIVLTTHGYTGLKRMLIGGTAERVVRHASCPVLVVRELEQRLAR